MYDVAKLEKEWKNYKFKQRRPWFIAVIFFFLIFLFTIYREDFLKILPKYSSDKNTSLYENNKTKKSTSLKPYVPTMSPKNESNHTVEKNSISEATQEIGRSMKKVKAPPRMKIEVSDREVDSREKKRKYLKIEVTDKYPVERKESKKSTKKHHKRSIKSVERSFRNSRKYTDSLYLAHAYYKKGDYAKAQKWALVTNDLNSKLEESWLIFAKSKAKNGQKREAVQILSAYIKKTNSAKAKVLLLRIKKGKI